MQVRVTREQGADVDDALDTLFPTEPYLTYSNFRPITERPDALRQLHQRRLHAAADDIGLLVARDKNGRALGCVPLRHRGFDSAHFGVPIAGIEAPLAVSEEELRLPALREIYRAAIDLVMTQGYRHVTAQSSSHDRVTCWVLQELGAFYVGTKISWMQQLTGWPHTPELQKALRIEMYDRSNIHQLPRSSWQRLHEWSGKAFDRGPYVFDLTVAYDRALALYQLWTSRAMTGESGDVLLVVRDRDEVVAYHSMMLLEDVSEAAGVRILGRGIGGTLPEYQGLFTALQKQCATMQPLAAGFLENETQASTVATINVFGKLGHQCLRSTATFHKCLDDPPQRRRLQELAESRVTG